MRESDKKILNRALEALTRFQAAEAVYKDSAAVAKMLRAESDRALVIILASYVEDALLDRILYMLPEGERYGPNIFKSGSLRNFEHRISIAKALGAVTEAQAGLLDAIRSMRNACSHSRKPISFKTPELRNVLSAMLGKEPADIFEDPNDIPEVRGAFIAAASLLLWALRTAPDERASTAHEKDVPKSVRTEQLLLAALQKKLPSKPAPGPHPQAKDT